MGIDFIRTAFAVFVFVAGAFGQWGGEITVLGTVTDPLVVITADLDGDTDLEMIAVSSSDSKVSWWENDGVTDDGYLAMGRQQVVASGTKGGVYQTQDIIAGDMDGDGDLDLVTASGAGGNGVIAWFTNNIADDGTFSSVNVIGTSVLTGTSVDVSDLDDDGDMDVVAGDYFGGIHVFENTATLPTDPPIWAAGVVIYQDPSYLAVTDIELADVDGDGDEDVMMAHKSSHYSYLENSSDGSLDIAFGTQDTLVTLDAVASGPKSIRAVDIDGDGDLDLLCANSNENTVGWYENLDAGTYGGERVVSSTVMWVSSAFPYDVNLDGDMDVVASSYTDNQVVWFANDGSEVWGSATIITSTAVGVQSVVMADLNGDLRPDCLTASSGDDQVGYHSNSMRFEDCNGNGLQDSADIEKGTSLDVNSDSTPDECQTEWLDMGNALVGTGGIAPKLA
ncbi:MAG: VCBS repeat-containing protein, partial [Planctomycetota bacterium]|nr:VCBS repeat-containing protein [Planctomycetota bacterium]